MKTGEFKVFCTCSKDPIMWFLETADNIQILSTVSEQVKNWKFCPVCGKTVKKVDEKTDGDENSVKKHFKLK